MAFLFRKHWKCETIEVSDGPEALGWALRTDFDLIVLDLVLPSVHGLELLRALQRDARTASIPVFIVTEHLWQYGVEELQELGATAATDKLTLLASFEATAERMLAQAKHAGKMVSEPPSTAGLAARVDDFPLFPTHGAALKADRLTL